MPFSPREAPEAPESAKATLIFGFLHLPYCNTEAKEAKKLWRTSSQACVGPFCLILACAQEDLAEVHAEGATGAKNRKLAASANEKRQQSHLMRHLERIHGRYSECVGD